MKQCIGIRIILLAVLFLLGACSLETAEEAGELCPSNDADRAGMNLSYIVLSSVQRCHVDSTDPACADFRSAFMTKTCPKNYPQCSSFGGEYFCGPDCPDELTACAGLCINPIKDNDYCGADKECKEYAACPIGSLCQKGECLRKCAKEEILCFDDCIKPLTSILYCGAKNSGDDGCSGYTRCEGSQRCVGGQCVTQCPEGQIVCGERCVNAMSDKAFCGADADCKNYKACEGRNVCGNGECMANCPETQELCTDGCYNLATSLENCGVCGNSCLKENVRSAKCVDGQCQERICYDGFVNCDGKFESGCNVEVRSDPDNCGVCGNSCMSLDHVANASCGLGECSILTCQSGFDDCDKTLLNGCEADLNTTTANCGECGVNCGANNMVGATCNGGVCSYAGCPAGYGDCDSKITNGCETLLNTTANCGVCGRDCMGLKNVVAPVCSGTSCVYSYCQPGFGDCNADTGDGCEVSLDASPNCGTCGEKCSALKNVSETICKSSKCDFVACLPTYGNCDADVSNGCETDLQKTASHCGACGTSCLNLSNVNEAVCSSGGCEIKSCKPGFGNCNGNPADGCEVDLKTTSNCGTCGNICPTPANANAPTCNSGICSSLTCKAGFGNCNGNPADGCEVDLKTTSNCGTCGNICPIPANSNGAACNSGVCGYTSCITGFGDCETTIDDGCETNTRMSQEHCGGCGLVCAGFCKVGKCIGGIEPTCPVGMVSCSTDPPKCCNTFSDCSRPGAICLLPSIE